MVQNTRSSPRAHIELSLECRVGPEHRAARSIDLSMTGLRLEMAPPPPPIGSFLEVSFDLPGPPARVEAIAETIWIEPGPEMPRLGLRFERFLQGYVELGDFLLEHLGAGGQPAA
jgi:PilZ domain-containing protein